MIYSIRRLHLAAAFLDRIDLAGRATQKANAGLPCIRSVFMLIPE